MYRNIVLTIIAACLLWICARDLAPWQPAGAATPPISPRGKEAVPVTIQADERNPVPVSMDLGRARLSVVVEDVRSGALRGVEPIKVETR